MKCHTMVGFNRMANDYTVLQPKSITCMIKKDKHLSIAFYWHNARTWKEGPKIFRFCIDFLSFLSKHSIPAHSLKINCIVAKLLLKFYLISYVTLLLKFKSKFTNFKKIAIMKTEKFFEIPERLKSYLEEHYFIYFVQYVFPQ